MITVLAEKPSVAREIAQFLGANSKEDGYFKGNNYQVTWAFGHLVQIQPMEKLGYTGKWTLSSLPFFPDSFTLEPRDSSVLKQIQVIDSLFTTSDTIICATDAGREGELIFRYIYDYLQCTKPIQRLWISSLTPSAIAEGFDNLRDGAEFEALYRAARGRNEADYLVGLNATMTLTSKVNQGLLSLGRVQTPTLAMICQRYLEHKNFKPTPYYSIKLDLAYQSIGFNALSEHFDVLQELEAHHLLLQDKKNAEIVDVQKKEMRETPPLLHDLTSLQRIANTRYAYTSSDTLAIAQSLYERKLITYPRTGSCYISEDMLPTVQEIMQCLALEGDRYAERAKELLSAGITEKKYKCINNSKVTDHHALLITSIQPKESDFETPKHKAIYNLIKERILESFAEDCIKEVTSFSCRVEPCSLLFQGKGVVVLKKGWRTLQSVDEQQEKEENEPQGVLPKLEPGMQVGLSASHLTTHYTKPKSLYTEASLLLAMETCAKEVEDEVLRQSLKQAGIGTPATRASIIENILKREYIQRDKKQLVPTDKGLKIYQAIKELDIAKVELTGDWEHRLYLMEQNEFDKTLFDKQIQSFTSGLVQAIKEVNIASFQNTASLGVCHCGGAIIEHSKGYYCSNTQDKENKPKTCSMPFIWKTISEKTIPTAEVLALFSTKKSKTIKGFTSKEGKKFDACLVVGTDNTLSFAFETPELGNCPKCKAPLKEFNLSYSCTKYKETGCDFSIFKEIAKAKLSVSDVKALVGGKPIKKSTFVGKKGTFSAVLKLDSAFKVQMEFENPKR
ncbi:DNA topoisomerase-3 [Flavobacterium croceum DSM 17960]|uniref:DNA topoisomerase n=1 Tax=Flavobacterium croceum DSM 17960 TaxID=1121886 RepID=A0A2S4N5A4_9FLAO|nr:type IA DNA topoisomerase [Flavobacterium croceum]POS00914.1 DNA topoisomerase-3 [Flavobacterium croceum DSM 17960]